MAIKKSEAGALSPADLEMVGKAEEYIDYILTRDYRRDISGYIVKVDFEMLDSFIKGELNHRSLRAVQERYEAAGWMVEIDFVGSCIKFS